MFSLQELKIIFRLSNSCNKLIQSMTFAYDRKARKIKLIMQVYPKIPLSIISILYVRNLHVRSLLRTM